MLLQTVNSSAVCPDTSVTIKVASMKRRQLTPREQNAAKRLAEIWNKKKTELGLTQETAAHRCGWETQGAFYQYVAGKIPLNLKATLKIADVLQVAPGEIFPELVQMIPRQLHVNDDTLGVYRTQKEVGALSKAEEILVKKYRQLQSKERAQAQAVIDALASAKIPKKRTVE